MSEGGAVLPCPSPLALDLAEKSLAQLKSDVGDGEDLDESAKHEGAHFSSVVSHMHGRMTKNAQPALTSTHSYSFALLK